MSYQVIISKVASKEIKVLSKSNASKIFEKIKSLSENPRPAGCKKLKVPDTALWRIRIGDYRVIYSIEDVIKIIEVIRVGHRGDVYQNL